MAKGVSSSGKEALSRRGFDMEVRHQFYLRTAAWPVFAGQASLSLQLTLSSRLSDFQSSPFEPSPAFKERLGWL